MNRDVPAKPTGKNEDAFGGGAGYDAGLAIEKGWIMKSVWVAIGLMWSVAGFVDAGPVAAMGQVVPGERVIRVAAPAGSMVGALHVERGMRVEQGAVLAVLRDEPLYRAQWERAKQQVAVAENELALAQAGERPELLEAQEWLVAAHEAEVKLLETRLARHETLEKGRHISQDEYDELAGRVAVLRARIRREQSMLAAMRTARAEETTRAMASLRLAGAQAVEAEVLLELQRIRAPMGGEILEIHAWPGEGIPAGGAVVSLGDTTNMMVLAEVYETDLGRVKPGQRAVFRGQVFAGEAGGEVVEVQRTIEGSRIFAVEPSAYVDRRIGLVRIRPDHPSALAAFSHAQVTVTILAP